MDSPNASSFCNLESLPPSQQDLFNKFSRGESVPIPFQIVHHAFEAIASAHPAVVALRQSDGATLTYGELDSRANRLANELRDSYGFRRGDRAVLVYSRCIEMVVFILAVLKAGGQYIPLDGGIIPEEQLAYTLSDSEARVVLLLPQYQPKVQRSMVKSARTGVAMIALDRDSRLWEAGNPARPHVEVSPDDGVYVIYTSGTTGRPKGVDVRHRGVTNTLLAEPSRLGIGVGSQVAQQLNVGFDMGAWEILGTMMNGGTLHIRGSGDKLWRECLQRVDTVIGTPSVILKQMVRREDFPNIRTIAVGGEPCPLALAEKWAPHVNFWNVCGPTEVSILNTAHLHSLGKTLSIGKPNPNTNVYILDEHENPTPIGEPGVMWVGGPGVSRGYLNLADLTASRYKHDKFAEDGRMMFNTGDLARWLEDGSLEPLGRQDDQVKILGFRVELDGVSRAIEKCKTVTKACALSIDDELWGFYSAPEPVDEDILKATVGQSLPYYATPKIWRHLPVIHLTANGKVDKAALRETAARGSQLIRSRASSPTLMTRNSQPFSMFSATGEIHSVCTLVDSSSESTKEQDTSPDYVLPGKNGFRGWRWLRHRGMSAYRKLFGVIFLTNLVVFICLLWQSRTNRFILPLPDLATVVAANLLGAVILRQDYVVNVIFWTCCRVPTWFPLWLRRHFARVYHNGGVHSGCAVSASIWWVIFTAAATRSYFWKDTPFSLDLVTLVLTYIIMLLLLSILLMAFPAIRLKMHDQFEWTHRFAGWTALGLVWAHVVLSANSASTPEKPLAKTLAATPAIYMVAITTLSIALPWMRLRRVKVVPEPLSSHAVRLHFDFYTPPPCTSRGIRITDRPLVEWHAFAAIPEPDGKGFSIVVSKAGDWTKKIIQNPPTSIWTRGHPVSGVLAIAPLFKKIVLVATGSGIGPCIPVIVERRVPVRILWSTRNPLKTYGQKIIDTILAADPDALIWDTDVRGRPDLVNLAYPLYRESNAECVCIISNGPATSRFVYRMESRGIPAFGPIWDS